MSYSSTMVSETRLQALARPADGAIRAAFEALARLPVPDHLVCLADQLESARLAGRLRAAGGAA